MNTGVFVQLGMIVISVFIVITFIRPAIGEIGNLQDRVASFEEAVAQAAELNNELQSLVNEANTINSEEETALHTYMPDMVDEILVVKDLETIVGESGMVLQSVAYGEGAGEEVPTLASVTGREEGRRQQASEETANTEPYTAQPFQLSVIGTYEQFKSLLGLLSQNHYPLFVSAISIGEQQSNESEAATAPVSSVRAFTLTVDTYRLRGEAEENPAGDDTTAAANQRSDNRFANRADSH